NPENFQKSLKNFSKKNIEAVFWTANAWASYINLSRDDPEAVSELWKAQSLMERCLELDENFYFAGPHLFLGTIKASLPKLLGGKPEEAKNHFEKALKLSNEKMLMVRVFYAQFYAVQVQNKELFESQLKQVLAFDVENAPEIRLINTLAKKRAKKLLENIDTYF
ncbi:hypothetical protein IT568_08995, partial [bacterium]|nr:hypothetical protein [bacterium]